MKRFSVDWAVTKKFNLLEITEKNVLEKNLSSEEEIINFLKELEPSEFYIEEGGADIFKAYAYYYKHKIFLINGEKVKEHRELSNLEKSDSNDTKIIASLIVEKPELFREYKQYDYQVANLALTTREYIKLSNELVRSKLRLISLKRRVILDQNNKKLIKKREESIKYTEKVKKSYNSVLFKQVKQHKMWNNYFEGIKGVGEVIASSLISEIKDIKRFSSFSKLRKYSGMVKKEGNNKINRNIKTALYQFSQSVNRGIAEEKWIDILCSSKTYYKDKYPDWSKGKVHNYALKRLETIFLEDVYDNWSKM